MTPGSTVFAIGAALEIVGLGMGTQATVVAWSLIVYGVVLLVTGYLR